MFKRFIASLVCFTFIFSNFQQSQAQNFSINQLPVPGTMIFTTPAYVPLTLKGLIVHPENALKFDFLMDTGNSRLKGSDLSDEALKIMKYFLTALTIPENDLWVNLSPYEKGRIIQDNFGQTIMGRDLLAQDYILKQLTASLIYPEKTLGKEFWRQVYSKAAKECGTTQIPVNTFNKVWIVPAEAVVWEHEGKVLIVKSRLKVMLEEDYLALQKAPQGNPAHALASQVVRAIVLPVLEKEVNEGKNFAQLRQMYQAMILATWYKKALKESILNKVYADKKKIAGIGSQINDVEAIYQRYLQAFKKGAFNYIKEDIDSSTGQTVPRKYFSGGFSLGMAMTSFPDTVRVIKSFSVLSSAIQQQILHAAEVKGQAIKVQTMMLWDWLSNPQRAPFIIAGAIGLAAIILLFDLSKITRDLRKQPPVLTVEEQSEYQDHDKNSAVTEFFKEAERLVGRYGLRSKNINVRKAGMEAVDKQVTDTRVKWEIAQIVLNGEHYDVNSWAEKEIKNMIAHFKENLKSPFSMLREWAMSMIDFLMKDQKEKLLILWEAADSPYSNVSLWAKKWIAQSENDAHKEWLVLTTALDSSDPDVLLRAKLSIDPFFARHPEMILEVLASSRESVPPAVSLWVSRQKKSFFSSQIKGPSFAKTALITVFMASLLTLPAFQPQAAAQAATGHTIAAVAHPAKSKTKTPIPVFKLIPEEEVIKIIEKANGQENFVADPNFLYSSLIAIRNDTVFKFLRSYKRFKDNYSPDQKRAIKEGIINLISTNPGSKLDPGVYTLLDHLMRICGHNFPAGFSADFMRQWIDSMRQNWPRDHSMLTSSGKGQDTAIRKKGDILVTIKKDYKSANPQEKLTLLKDALKIEQDHVRRWAVAELKQIGSAKAKKLLLEGAEGKYGLTVKSNAKNALKELNANRDDSAMLTVRSDNKHLGGIALNAKMLDMQIKRDGNGVPLALSQQPLDEINIQGFVPQIISIQPVDLPALFGLSS